MKRADIARLLGWHLATPPEDQKIFEGCDFYQRIHDPGPLDYAWAERNMNDSEFVSMLLWCNGTMVGSHMVEQRCPQILLPILHPDVDRREAAVYEPAGVATVPGSMTFTVLEKG